MNFEKRRRRNGPTFKTHQKAHEEVLATEAWFADGEPVIGEQFTAAKAKERKDKVIDLLFRTASHERRAGDAGIADQLEILADKIFYCQPGRRCGSLPCPEASEHSKKQRWRPKRPAS